MFDDLKYSDKRLNEYIDDFISLLGFLSLKNFEMPTILSYRHLWTAITPGIDSSIKTLKGIKELVGIGDFVDSYLLIRKLRDNLLFDCVIAQDAETNHFLNDDFLKSTFDDDGNVDFDKFQKAMFSFVNRNLIHEVDNEKKDEIEYWKTNRIRYLDEGKEDNWMLYKNLKKRLEKDNNLIKTINVRFLSKRIKDLQVLNRYVHSSTFEYSGNHFLTNPEHVGKILAFLQTIKLMLISYLMCIKSRLFGYEDLLDNPDGFVEGTQYLIPPGIIKELNEIKEVNKGLYYFLKENNVDSMIFKDIDMDA